jgi:hypothetical protein
MAESVDTIPSRPSTAEWPSESEVPRRGALGWLARAGIASIAAVAGLLGSAAPAAANHCPSGLYHCGCCCLALPNSNLDWPGCGSGYTLRAWSCCRSGFIWRCEECTKGSSCWVGPFQRSRCYISSQCGCC